MSSNNESLSVKHAATHGFTLRNSARKPGLQNCLRIQTGLLLVDRKPGIQPARVDGQLVMQGIGKG